MLHSASCYNATVESADAKVATIASAAAQPPAPPSSVARCHAGKLRVPRLLRIRAVALGPSPGEVHQ